MAPFANAPSAYSSKGCVWLPPVITKLKERFRIQFVTPHRLRFIIARVPAANETCVSRIEAILANRFNVMDTHPGRTQCLVPGHTA